MQVKGRNESSTHRVNRRLSVRYTTKGVHLRPIGSNLDGSAQHAAVDGRERRRGAWFATRSQPWCRFISTSSTRRLIVLRGGGGGGADGSEARREVDGRGACPRQQSSGDRDDGGEHCARGRGGGGAWGARITALRRRNTPRGLLPDIMKSQISTNSSNVCGHFRATPSLGQPSTSQ